MADEAPEEGGGGGGSVLKKFGPLALIVLLAQLVIGWVLVAIVWKEKAPEQPQDSLIPEQTSSQRAQSETKREKLPFLYNSPDLKSITANPAGTNAERFVMFTVTLGLVATDTEKGEDVTDTLAEDTETLEKITAYNNLTKAIITSVVRLKTVDQLDGERLGEVREEIKIQLNKQVFDKLFPIGDESENKLEVRVHDVIFSDIIIQ